MAIKDSLKNVAADLGDVAGGLEYNTLPMWQGLRDQMYENYNKNTGPYMDYFKDMAMDPSKRGYSPETVNAMRANATGAIAGQKRSTEANVRKNIAASGMGNTGLATHMARRIGKDAMTAMREGNRDVDLAQAEAQRADLWNAQNAWKGGLDMSSQMYRDQMQAAIGQQNTYATMANVLAQKIPALTGAHNVSFWGPNPLSGQIVGGALAGATAGIP